MARERPGIDRGRVKDHFGLTALRFGQVSEDFYSVAGRLCWSPPWWRTALVFLWALDAPPKTLMPDAKRIASERREAATRTRKHAAVLGDDLVD